MCMLQLMLELRTITWYIAQRPPGRIGLDRVPSAALVEVRLDLRRLPQDNGDEMDGIDRVCWRIVQGRSVTLPRSVNTLIVTR